MSATATPRLPDFVIIGAGKSASTWLQLALRQHPAIFMPDTEIPFFEDPHYDANDLSALHASLRDAAPGALLGIKRPNYLCTPECAPRIARHLPNAKLIAILRNPVERAVSQYFHLVRSGRIPVEAADKAFGRYLAGNFDSPVTKRMVLEFGRYAEGITNYRKYFPDEAILLITDIELRKGMREAFQKTCRFLNVSDEFVPRDLSIPRNQGVYSAPMLSVLKSMNNLRVDFDQDTGAVTTKSGSVAQAAGLVVGLGSRISAITRLFAKKPSAISPATRAALLRYYLPDIRELESITQMDLSPWKSTDREFTDGPSLDA